MVTDTAVALLRDGSRIPLSDPLDEARRHWRDGEYDSDVVGIEAAEIVTVEARAPPKPMSDLQPPLVGPAPAPPEQATVGQQLAFELAIAFDER